MIGGKVVVTEAGSLPWNENYLEQIGKSFYTKRLHSDVETGMGVMLLKYPAGMTNPHHTHPCGHGMYVLEGKLVTHSGVYEPGTFVWFPEGEPMEHGASADGDVLAVFVYNKPFGIDYLDVPAKSSK